MVPVQNTQKGILFSSPTVRSQCFQHARQDPDHQRPVRAEDARVQGACEAVLADLAPATHLQSCLHLFPDTQLLCRSASGQKEKAPGAGEATQWGKRSPCKLEDQSLNPQNSSGSIVVGGSVIGVLLW